MKLQHSQVPAVLFSLVLFTSSLVVPAAAQNTTSKTPQSPTSKTEQSANKEEYQRLVNEGAEESPVSPDELHQAAKKPALSLRQRVLQKAISQIGVKESGINCQKYSRYFGHTCEAWCADFVSWAINTSGNGNKKLPWKSPSWVPHIITWGQNGHKVKTPIPGDIFTLNSGQTSHVGFVRKVGSGYFLSVEGNGHGSNQVKSFKRSLSQNNVQFFRFDRDS